ncbi:NADP-dependent 3-hydroxy acid dehydrogenase YdfG [Rhodobacter aestuarii]|uniref:NADP-dependent 3-hydroxy acid dehydrogenase YdfG n=1 Tax=Rhodobacter aestuarii TaxID=453582 RepID=A0A1N7IYN2_9RHOB|nr:oxidoreductase [Rhodobacter aestuarii]PTV97379.1 NADP-dependent 3-hydroxy acid dehydrogenase YdfG [Rhodobacter aestuarii]SIS42190.1 NADP-dependent 3-hydroxy acid dehydrogenase YdfG [Rhodobacter aestuarii]
MTDTPVWFITGCSTGFGREIAKLVLAKGWPVVMTARRTETLAELVEGHEEHALAVSLDVTDAAQIAAAVEQAEARFGRIDVLVNNAGYGYFSAIEEGEDAEIRRQFETNVFGLNALTQKVLPGMRARRKGHIINFSSIGGLISYPALGYYCATKFAVEALSEALAQEVAPLGLKVTIIEPGGFRTDWAGRSVIESQTRIDDYEATSGALRDGLRAASGHQDGDPQKLAEAVLMVAAAENPPLRLLLSKQAYDRALERVEEMRKSAEAWKEVTLGADFPPGA